MPLVFQYVSNCDSDRLNAPNRLQGDANCPGLARLWLGEFASEDGWDIIGVRLLMSYKSPLQSLPSDTSDDPNLIVRSSR